MKWQPRALSSWPNATLCAASHPPSTQSVPERRMPSAMLAGSAARTASNTASGKRMRFSSEPPYSSMRWLEIGERNWCSR
ncbi:hypothetical protein FQZ97_1045910 [compost metagenome]